MSSKSPSTSTLDERSRKGKVPKRINKAVRERLKREHLNELFIELADTLELNQQNNGKASILSEATRFLKDVFGQIESLKKEHTSLLSESKYVTTEKNELEEETSVLESEISKLQTEIESRMMNQSKPDLNATPAPEYHHHYQQQHPELAGLPVFQGQSAATVLVLPIQPDHLQGQDVPERTQLSLMYNKNSNVSKPCPRYASAADSSWPSRLLGERLKANE